MRIHRVHTTLALEPGLKLQLEGASAHYLGRVVRVAAGQTIVLFNGDGHDYVSEVLQVDKRSIALEVSSRLPGVREPGLHVTVVQAISRGERMDQTLQKCTELGATAFQPLESERVEVHLRGDKRFKRREHWQGVAISACEQSGRAVVPPVRDFLDVDGWLASPGAEMRLVLAPDAQERLASLDYPPSVELAVGPEGGFSDAELAMMHSHGVLPVSLGPRILRTETAAPAALAIILALTGDI